MVVTYNHLPHIKEETVKKDIRDNTWTDVMATSQIVRSDLICGQRSIFVCDFEPIGGYFSLNSAVQLRYVYLFILSFLGCLLV